MGADSCAEDSCAARVGAEARAAGAEDPGANPGQATRALGIYLDNAATTRLREEVWGVMATCLQESWGNPSSVHRRGVAARDALDRARAQVARAVGARPQQVTFTGSGTEANNLALQGILRASQHAGAALWIGPTEHASVRGAAEALAAEGFPLATGRLNGAGELDLDALERSLTPHTVLAAQMLVSNEFGSIYPTALVAQALRRAAPGAWLHVDAVQGLGKLPLSMAELGADSLCLSAHKIHGPQGVGALVCAREVTLKPLFHGGGQEAGLRSGTENLAGIVGFGLAVELATAEQSAALEALWQRREELVAGLERIAGLRCRHHPKRFQQQPSILSLLVPGAPAEVWLHHLDARGVIVSVGSACQAQKREVSPVLLAAGLSARQAKQVLRLSLSEQTRREDIHQTLQAFEDVAQDLAHL